MHCPSDRNPRSTNSSVAFAFAVALSGLAARCGSTSGPPDAMDAMDALDAAHDANEGGLPPDAYIPPRAPGDRTPRSAACDDADPLRCGLPWPSNVFTVTDPTSATQLRVAVQPMAIGVGDSVAPINRADGFSRVTPIATGYHAVIDPMTVGDGTVGAVRVLVEDPGASFAAPVPLRIVPIVDSTTAADTLLVAYPRRPLAAATDYVAIVTDDLRTTSGAALTPTRNALVALGLAPPATLDELALYAYHAPARATLAAAGIDVHHVLRLWDFTTRSNSDPIGTLDAMRTAVVAAVTTNAVTVAIDTVTVPTSGSVALIVEGRLQGVPNFVAMSGSLMRDATGAPMAVGVHDAPFRVAVPQGTGDYRIIMYGHGLGGNVHDTAFDTDITGVGAAKVGIQYAGFTDTDVLNTFASFAKMLTGVDHATANLDQSVADGFGIQAALGMQLGDALAAAMVGGMPNPCAGRRPLLDIPVWAGGSLGGTMGLVYAHAEPTIRAAVLNVPGAGWTHFVVGSQLFGAVSLVARATYHTDVDLQLAVAMSQTVWDAADGASWADADTGRDLPLLLQESIGDPILPNPGTELAAASVNAAFVGAVLHPVLQLDELNEADDRSALTQYHVPSSVTAPYQIHGFGAGSSIAGMAARQQIFDFIQSVWAGAPRIVIPDACVANTPSGSCDFSAM